MSVPGTRIPGYHPMGYPVTQVGRICIWSAGVAGLGAALKIHRSGLRSYVVICVVICDLRVCVTACSEQREREERSQSEEKRSRSPYDEQISITYTTTHIYKHRRVGCRRRQRPDEHTLLSKPFTAAHVLKHRPVGCRRRQRPEEDGRANVFSFLHITTQHSLPFRSNPLLNGLAPAPHDCTEQV